MIINMFGRKTLLTFLLCAAGSLASAQAMAAACNDGIDNDGDGLTDYAADPGCYAGTDGSENNPGAPAVGGVYMPSLQDERDAYDEWGWSYTASDEPDFAADPSYSINDPDIHYDTEADDLWNNIMGYLRTGQRGYLDRARAWATYMKGDYIDCHGTPSDTLCDDGDLFGHDHMYGWGLLAWYELTGDTEARDVAEQLGDMLDAYWKSRGSGSAWPTPGSYSMFTANGRRAGRHLLLLTRLADVVGTQKWIGMRDDMIDLIMQSPDWNATYGMYFVSQQQTDVHALSAGAYAAGARVMSSFHIGILTEALYHAYLQTSDDAIKNRLLAMADFAFEHGLDPTYDHTASWLGVDIDDGSTIHSYSYDGNPSGWDPVYSTSLVNLLVLGGRLGNNNAMYTKAVHALNQSTKFKRNGSGLPDRQAADNEVHHFIDSRTAPGGTYFAYNKGELKYAYLLFDPARGPIDLVAPDPPGSVIVQ